MHILIIGALPDRPTDLGAWLAARGHEIHRAAPGEPLSSQDARAFDLIVLDPTCEACAEVASVLQAEADGRAALLLAAVDPGEEGGYQRALDVGVDECLPVTADEAYLDASLMLLEQRARKRYARYQLEQELAVRIQQQATVAELERRVLAGQPVQALADYTVEAVVETLEVDTCEVLLSGSGDDGRILRAGQGVPPSSSDPERLRAGTDTQAGFALSASEPVVIENLADETRFAPAGHLLERGVVSAVSVGIRGEQAHYGLLEVGATEKRTFNEHDVKFLRTLTDVLANAVERKHAEKSFRESEALARAILETTVDGVITIDERGIIQSFNTAAERIFGYDAEEVVGENVSVLMPPPYREEHDGYLQSYHETGRRKIIGIGREVVGLRKDGTTFPLDLAVSEIRLGDRTVFTGVVRDISDRRKLEQEILRISEQERRRIGQDLHDGLGQMLTGIGLITKNLARSLEDRNDPAATEAAEITEMIREADQHARGLARGLVPVDLEATGLSSALQRLAVNAERLFGIRCTFTEVGSVLLHDNTKATHLYRIAQEAVSNAVKHGRAQTVKISLAGGSNQLRLRIQDDGIGFPDELDEETRGMGVRIMHYRARIIGANLEVSDTLDGGTTLTCTLRHLDRPIPIGGEEYGKPV